MISAQSGDDRFGEDRSCGGGDCGDQDSARP